MLFGNDPETADVYLRVIGNSQGAYHPTLVTFVVKVFLYDVLDAEGMLVRVVCNGCEVLKPILIHIASHESSSTLCLGGPCCHTQWGG